MNIVNRLTLRHLRQNRGRTLITIIGIVLSVAMVCAVAGFVMSMRDMLMRTLIANGEDYHIAYYGVTTETAEKIAAEDVFSTHYTKESGEEGLVTLYVRFEDPGRDYWDIASAISAKYEMQGMSSNSELLALEGVIAQDNVFMTFILIAAIVILIIVVGSVIVIANAFYISASERVRQFGLLKSAGATKSQIGRSIMFEALALALIAIPLGIALGFLIQMVVLYFTNDLLLELSAMNNNTLNFRVVFHPMIIYISVAIAAVTLTISAWLPARRAARVSAIDAIRQTRDVRIRPKQLKTSRLTGKLFGFEGTLASKSLKRSRGKYRATVISLTVSIVLFISVSSLVWVMNKSVQMEYGGYNFDVYIMTSESIEATDDMELKLASIHDSETVRYQYLSGAYTALPEGFLSEAAEDYLWLVHEAEPSSQSTVRLISYPDSEFSKLAPLPQDGLSGVLINTSGTVSLRGKHAEFEPYEFKPGMELALVAAGESADGDTVLKLAAELKTIPDGVPAPMYNGERVNILLPESAFRKLASENADYMSVYTVFTTLTEDPVAFCEAAAELLPEGVAVNNISEMTRLNRNIALIIMLFGYGFIAMMSLIAVTSVISTISTGMALRKQEFAMLFSAGMTPGGMKRMLNLESLLYGAKSLVIGLPIGIALSYLIYKSTANTIEFAYALPLPAVLISIAAVMLLTFGTMRYGKHKLRKTSIVEALRSEAA